MKSLHSILTALFLLIISTVSGQVSDATFKKAINSTTDFFISIKQINSSEHQVKYLVTGAHPTDPEKIISYNMTTILKNYGDHYVLITPFPKLIAPVYDIFDNGGYKYTFDDMFDGFRKIGEYEYTRGEGAFPILVVNRKFGAKNAIPIMGGIVKSINKIKECFGGMWLHQRKLVADKIKDFGKDNLSIVENAWFPYYIDYERIMEFEKTPTDGAQGYWSFFNSNIDMSFDLYNYDDRFEIIITRDVGDGNGEKFLADIENFISRNKYKKATSTESVTFQNGRYAGVRATYAKNGKTKGDDLITGMDEYYNYGNRLSKIYQ